jgi:hypothetical protein
MIRGKAFIMVFIVVVVSQKAEKNEKAFYY